jgi:Tfp pilus assembly protein PilN
MHKCYLLTVLIPVLQSTCDTFVLMQDNVPVHHARETIQLLQREMLNFIGPDLWPPNSPGLNPIDFKVWGRMQQRVYDKETLVTNVDELKQRLIEVLAGLQQKANSAVDE